jgi:hypothetical protein
MYSWPNRVIKSLWPYHQNLPLVYTLHSIWFLSFYFILITQHFSLNVRKSKLILFILKNKWRTPFIRGFRLGWSRSIIGPSWTHEKYRESILWSGQEIPNTIHMGTYYFPQLRFILKYIINLYATEFCLFC